MIDLHTHTNESDGTFSPFELIDEAAKIRLEALAICDHDTFAGYDQAVSAAKTAGVDLVCGIELTTRLTSPRERSLHLLGYFLKAAPPASFRAWLDELQEQRRDRNRRLIAKLQDAGVQIELSEVENVGRSLTGRPHFARVLVRKGYAQNTDEAFRKYLDESAPCFVEREAPTVAEGIQRLRSAGALPIVAHPVRLGIRDPIREEMLFAELQQAGLGGLEVFHSDHQPADIERYLGLVNRFRLAATGGSDFHGDHRPQVALGTGLKNNLNIPRSILDRLREIGN